MKRSNSRKNMLNLCGALLLAGQLTLATGCDQLQGIMTVAKVALRDSVAATVTDVVDTAFEGFTSNLGGLVNPNAS